MRWKSNKIRLFSSSGINDRNNNKMPLKSSLDKRFSDVVGETNYQILDQNLTRLQLFFRSKL